ncbi:hypothetical protein BJ546DRAFT_975482 [Cryomyces antarcticus]
MQPPAAIVLPPSQGNELHFSSPAAIHYLSRWSLTVDSSEVARHLRSLGQAGTPQSAIMGFLKHFRSKSKLKEAAVSKPPSPRSAQPARYGRDFTARLGEEELERIFGFVCPHALDDTYESSERSMIGDGCMLCDLRDLANCTRVCLKWYQVAQKLLYVAV